MDNASAFSPISTESGESGSGESGSESEDEVDTISEVCTNSMEPVLSVSELPDISSILDSILDEQMATDHTFGHLINNPSLLNTCDTHLTSNDNQQTNPFNNRYPNEQTVDSSLSSYLKNIDHSWHNPSQWIEDMKYEFASINRKGYDFDSVEFAEDIESEFLSGSEKLKAFQEGKCFKCNKYPCDPKWCSNCCQVYCKICIMESVLRKENCGQNDQHMSRDLTAEEYEKRFGRVRVRCEYGCRDTDQSSYLFSQYNLGDTHNRGKECPYRRCNDCKMWKTKTESQNGTDYVKNCFLNHFSKFSAFIDLKLQLYFNQMYTQYQNQMIQTIPPEPMMCEPIILTEAVQTSPMSIPSTVAKTNIQLKYELSEKEREIYIANKRIVSLSTEIERAKEQMLAMDQVIGMVNTHSLQHRRSKIERNDSFCHRWNVPTAGLKLILNPSDDNPKVTENYVQVLHPKHGIKRINGIQDNMSWDQLKHHIITQFNNEFGQTSHIESYEDFDLVSLRMRVEAGHKSIGGFYYPTMIFNLVPTSLLERGTAYEVEVKDINKLHKPSDLAKKVGIMRNGLTKTKNMNRRAKKRKMPMGFEYFLPFCRNETNFKRYLVQLVDQRIEGGKQRSKSEVCTCDKMSAAKESALESDSGFGDTSTYNNST